MNYDTLAFFNQQLGTMLREGIPLEGALQQLCAEMQHGELRAEMEALAADLKIGTPLNDALTARKLPAFYVQMVRVGVKANDLPGMLLMLADYYRQVDSVLTRLKGLMVYPLLVLIAAFGLSCFLTTSYSRLIGSNFGEIMGLPVRAAFTIALWAPPILIGIMLVAVIVAFVIPAVGRRLRWRLPAFRDAKLAQVASAMGLMLKNGGNLDDALGLVQKLEAHTPASRELAQWQARLASGRGTFADMAPAGGAFPPMFLWLVGNAGEDLAAGFQRAAEMYSARAVYRTETFLYSVLPCSILVLGVMIGCQLFPVVKTFSSWMVMLN